MWLFAIFAGIPLIEIALFILIGGAIGLWPTLGTVILTAAAGTWLVRAQGLAALQQLRDSLSEFRDPSEPLAHGAMVLVAGILLLTPGFFTDGISFALLVPPVRAAIFRYLGQRIRAELHYRNTSPERHQRNPAADDVIDVEFTDLPPSDSKPNGPGQPIH